MVKIRLTRTGKKNSPCYRIVVIDARTKRDGGYIEKLGHYNPILSEEVVNVERADYWISKGAQPSSTVADIIRRAKTGEATCGYKGQKKVEPAKVEEKVEEVVEEAVEEVAEATTEAAEAAE